MERGCDALVASPAFPESSAGRSPGCCAVFMRGLAAGRILRIVLDGMPHWLLVVYTVVEVVLGVIAIVLYRTHVAAEAP